MIGLEISPRALFFEPVSHNSVNRVEQGSD